MRYIAYHKQTAAVRGHLARCSVLGKQTVHNADLQFFRVLMVIVMIMMMTMM